MTSLLQTYRLPQNIFDTKGAVPISTQPHIEIRWYSIYFSRLHHFEKIFLQARASIGAKIPPNRPGMTIYSIIKFQDIVSKD